MADIIKITDGTTSVDLYYDIDGFEMLADGNDFGIAKHKNLYHDSAALDGSMLVRHAKENREWSFKLAIRGTTNAAVAATLGTLNRLIGQARTYQMSNAGQKVYLEIQLDGASQATYYDVIDVDYSKAAFFDYYNLRHKEMVFGDGLSLKVITKPVGYGVEETLENFIANPSFEGYAGLADGWNSSKPADIDPDVTTDQYAQYASSGNAGEGEWFAQKFTMVGSGTVSTISLTIDKFESAGSPTGNLWVEIYSDNSGTPNAIVGSKSNNINIETGLTAPQSTATFSWSSGAPTLTNGTIYYIVTKTSDYTNAINSAIAIAYEEEGAASVTLFKYESDKTPQWTDVLVTPISNYTITFLGATISSSHTAYLVGSLAARIVTNATDTHGIYSDTIACTNYQGDNFVGYVWVYRAAGDDITLSIVGNSSGTIDTATYNAATVTATGKDGVSIFKKLLISGAVGASDTVLALKVERLSGDARQPTAYYVDKCYLQLGTSTLPSAWSSGKKIYNYYDENNTEIVPYIDLADINGDIESPLQIDIYPSGNNKICYIHIGRKSITPRQSWWEEGDTNADPGRTLDKSDSLSADTEWRNVISGFYTPLENYGAYGRFVLICAIKSSASKTAKIRGGVISGAYPTIYSEEKDVSLTTNWEIYTTPSVEYRRDNENPIYFPYFQLKLDSGTATISTDFIMVMPCDEAYTITQVTLANADYERCRIKYDGQAVAIFQNLPITSYSAATHLGGQMLAVPYNEQRFFFMFYGTSTSNRIHTLDYANTVIKYKPQTEFLLP